MEQKRKSRTSIIFSFKKGTPTIPVIVRPRAIPGNYNFLAAINKYIGQQKQIPRRRGAMNFFGENKVYIDLDSILKPLIQQCNGNLPMKGRQIKPSAAHTRLQKFSTRVEGVPVNGIIVMLAPYVELDRKLQDLEKQIFMIPRTDMRLEYFSIKWTELLLELESLHDYNLIVEGLKLEGECFIQLQDVGAALFTYKKMKRFTKHCKKFKDSCLSYKYIARCYRRLGDRSKAMEYYKKMLQYAWDTGLKEQELDAYDNIGLEYFYEGNIEKALKYHEKSMKGITEEDKSPLKTSSKLSLVRKKADLQEKIDLQYSSLTEEERKEIYRSRVNKMLNRDFKKIKDVDISQLLKDEPKIPSRELPTASGSRDVLLPSPNSITSRNSALPSSSATQPQIRFIRKINRIANRMSLQTFTKIQVSNPTSSKVFGETDRHSGTNPIYSHLSQGRRFRAGQSDAMHIIQSEFHKFRLIISSTCKQAFENSNMISGLEYFISQIKANTQ